MLRIIPFEEKYREQVRDVCIHTGSPDNLVNKQHHDFTLLMYCDPYLDMGSAFLLVDDEKVVGYILCCEDVKKFDMTPYFEKIQEVSPDFAHRASFEEYEPYKDEYPAHLHIDLLEDYTGNGNGTKLMKTLLAYLKEKGVPGIMVGVSKSNERAFKFYQKMGYKIVQENEYGAALAQKLGE